MFREGQLSSINKESDAAELLRQNEYSLVSDSKSIILAN